MFYKNSQYNVVLNQNDANVTIWNTNSGAIIKLDKEVWKELKQNKFDGATNIYLEGLFEQGLVVPKNLDEVNSILVNKAKALYENIDTISLVVAPTLGCNFRCVYCFENTTTKMEHMSIEVQTQILKYLNDLISSGSYKKIDISWFGGEPLLGYEDVIKPLSENILNFCHEKDIEYAAGIVTNGYYLTSDVITSLICDYKVTDFQITFDGTRQAYCSAKRTNAIAYEKVKDNMFNLSRFVKEKQLKVTIKIRLNVNRYNYEDLKKFVFECKNDSRYYDNINFYLGRLQGKGDNYLSLHEFELLEEDFEQITHRPAHSILTKKGIWCKQQAINNMCIGPTGEIYKCERHFGIIENIVGHISYGFDYNDFFYRFIKLDIVEKCKRCVLLPVCLGGCPHCAMQRKCGYDCVSTVKYAKKLARKQVGI